MNVRMRDWTAEPPVPNRRRVGIINAMGRFIVTESPPSAQKSGQKQFLMPL
jgi:hypothetical protein